jgi:hypothetical protein
LIVPPDDGIAMPTRTLSPSVRLAHATDGVIAVPAKTTIAAFANKRTTASTLLLP